MIVLSILDNQFFLSGVNAYWQSMAVSLSAMGFSVVTVGLDGQHFPWNRDYFQSLPGSSERLDITGQYDVILNRARLLLEGLQPTLVFHHYSDFGIEASLLCRNSGKKKYWRDVYVCHSDDPDHYERVRRWKGRLGGVICVSGQTRDYLINRIDMPKERVGVVHYAWIKDAARASKTFQPNTLGHEFAINRPIEILFAGRLEAYQKRAGDIAEFAQQLDSFKLPFKLHVAGCGSLENNLMLSLENQVRGGRVVFHGFLPPQQLYQLMQRCDLYTSFSEFEGISTSLIQAMGCGLVPLVTKTLSGTDFLSPDENAFLFEVGNIESAARAVQSLAADFSKLCMMSKQARRTVGAKFGLHQQRKQLKFLLERIVGKI